MRYLLVLLLALPLAAAEGNFKLVQANNVSVSTNIVVALSLDTLRLDGGGIVTASATVASASNHIDNTVHFFIQFTADGTNWTRTNMANTLVATTLGGPTGATIASNFAESGYSGVRIVSYKANVVTNITISNVSLSTWHSPR